MTAIYDKNAKKKATNVSINSDLLKKAKEYNINLSSNFEQSLIKLVKEKEIENWQKQNKNVINSYNKRINENGTFSDGLRSF